MKGDEIKRPEIIAQVNKTFANKNNRIHFRSAYDMYFEYSDEIGL